jgi:hypothetical protein
MSEQVCVNKEKGSRPSAWLNSYARKVTSQYGEEGIIEKALEVIGQGDRWCVEFGSWDGRNCSNTYNLIKTKGYSAVLIEASSKRFAELTANFRDNDKVICLNKFVGFESTDNLDTILNGTEIPKDFDVLSIDIDGNDYHVWEAVRQYKPKVVVIEFNPTIPSTVEFVQPRDFGVTQGSSLLSISKLGKSKGYELVAVTKNNGIFVDSKYFRLFGIEDNSVDALWTDRSFITHIFCGCDGTIFIRGYAKSPWHQIPLKESKMQILPRWAIKRVGDRNPIRRKLGRFYRRLLKER